MASELVAAVVDDTSAAGVSVADVAPAAPATISASVAAAAAVAGMAVEASPLAVGGTIVTEFRTKARGRGLFLFALLESRGCRKIPEYITNCYH